MTSSFGEYGGQRHNDSADIHEEKESVEDPGHDSPLFGKLSLSIFLVETVDISPQDSLNLLDITFDCLIVQGRSVRNGLATGWRPVSIVQDRGLEFVVFQFGTFDLFLLLVVVLPVGGDSGSLGQLVPLLPRGGL